MIKYDWSKYNLKRDREAICQFKEYSKNSKKRPPIQKGLYNHVRDIYALAILNSKNSKKKIDILDYGGNLISNLSLLYKINTEKIKVWIYNPYSSEIALNKKVFKYVRFIKDIDLIKKKKFSLCCLGSVIQYCKDLKSIVGRNVINSSKYVLITHTPISTIKKDFYLKQINHKNLYQKIHSINNIKKKLLLKKYSIEFKSYNDYKHSGLKNNNKIESTNILFKRNR